MKFLNLFLPKSVNDFYLIIIFVGAFVARLLFLINVQTELVSDFLNYHMLASNIAAGLGHTMHELPVAWQGMGYPFVLGFFYYLTGTTSIMAGGMLNIIFSMGTLFFCYFIYIKIFDTKKYALIALALTAFLPQYIAYVNVIGTEVFFTFILSAIIFTKLYFLKRLSGYIAISVLIGLASLIRPFMMAYPLIIGVFVYSTTKAFKKSVVLSVFCMAIVFIIISPWTIRNYMHFERLILVSYNSGYVLYINNNDVNTRGVWMDPLNATIHTPYRHDILLHALEERTIHQVHEIEPYFNTWARQWILQNPIEYLKLGILRVNNTFFTGANDIPQWAANMSPLNDIYLTGLERNWHYRNHNFIEASLSIATLILTGAGFLFMFAMLKTYTIGLFTHKLQLSLHTAVIFINFAFFIVIPFFFEGQARYAFPAFIFIIPAAVRLIEHIKN